MTTRQTTINEGPRYESPLGNFHYSSTPFSKVNNLRGRIDRVSSLSANDPEPPRPGGALSSSEDMAPVCRLYVLIATALALCKHSVAEWNATAGSANRTEALCHRHGNIDNCTADAADTGQWNGHFSRCPEELTHYCVHGECRYITEQKAPSCRCQEGYIGSRCEYLDLDWRIGEKRQIIIACLIAGLVSLILVIVFICFCSHRRCRWWWRRSGRRREEVGLPRSGTEKLRMMDTGGGAPATLTAESAEPPHTHAV